MKSNGGVCWAGPRLPDVIFCWMKWSFMELKLQCKYYCPMILTTLQTISNNKNNEIFVIFGIISCLQVTLLSLPQCHFCNYLWKPTSEVYCVWFQNGKTLPDTENWHFQLRKGGGDGLYSKYTWALLNDMILYIYIPGTQMTLVLNGKGLLLEGAKRNNRGQTGSRYIYIIL